MNVPTTKTKDKSTPKQQSLIDESATIESPVAPQEIEAATNADRQTLIAKYDIDSLIDNLKSQSQTVERLERQLKVERQKLNELADVIVPMTFDQIGITEYTKEYVFEKVTAKLRDEYHGKIDDYKAQDAARFLTAQGYGDKVQIVQVAKVNAMTMKKIVRELIEKNGNMETEQLKYMLGAYHSRRAAITIKPIINQVTK